MNNLRSLAGAMALCVLYSVSANATCVAKNNFIAFVAERFPQARVTVLGKTDSELLLSAVNRLARPPLTAEEIVIADVAEAAAAVPVALFAGGCMSRLGHLPRPMVRSILNTIARNGA